MMIIGKFEKGRWIPDVYIHPSDIEGHVCCGCVFNIINLDNYHSESHICCNPVSPYHCIDVHIPICNMSTRRQDLLTYLKREDRE